MPQGWSRADCLQIGAANGPQQGAGAFTRPRHAAIVAAMKELIRTNDVVVISFAESLMRDAGIAHFVADGNMSVMEGSLGVLPRRLLVEDERIEEARRLLQDAGIGTEARDG